MFFVGDCAVALEATRISAIVDADSSEAEGIIDLHELFGVDDRAGPAKLLVLADDLAVRVRGRIAFLRVSTDSLHVPAFVAGALRRRCLRGVLRGENGLFYMLDTGALPAPQPHGEATCASD